MIRMVCKSCGIEKYYDSYLRLATYLTWSSHKIQTPEMKETNTGLVSHTDRSFIIILHQNQVNSFEVKAKDDEWFNIDFSPSSFSHRRWCSNGVYKFVSNIYIYTCTNSFVCTVIFSFNFVHMSLKLINKCIAWNRHGATREYIILIIE